jgi:hypothetical protein
VDVRSRTRLVVAHAVLQAMRSKDFRTDASETSLSGEHVIVPALPDDTMGEFFDQVRQAAGTIYVATLEGDELAVLSMSPSPAPKHAAPSEEDVCPIHRHSDLKMVIDYLRVRRAPLRCYEVPPSVMLELVDEKPPVPAGLVP